MIWLKLRVDSMYLRHFFIKFHGEQIPSIQIIISTPEN